MLKSLDYLDFTKVFFKSGIVYSRFGVLIKFWNSHHTNIQFVSLYRSIFLLTIIMGSQKEVFAVKLSKFGVRLNNRQPLDRVRSGLEGVLDENIIVDSNIFHLTFFIQDLLIYFLRISSSSHVTCIEETL